MSKEKPFGKDKKREVKETFGLEQGKEGKIYPKIDWEGKGNKILERIEKILEEEGIKEGEDILVIDYIRKKLIEEKMKKESKS